MEKEKKSSIESELELLNINEDDDDCPPSKDKETTTVTVTNTSEGSATEDLTAKEMEEEDTTFRHCAFCLNPVPLKDVLVCGKCKRRAYCSKECQSNDWTMKKTVAGQGHKYWCDVEAGEEDIDWEVAPVEGKGLGLIAKRFIPARYRIMVDAPRGLDHPKVMDLMPLNGTLEEKRVLNHLYCFSSTREWSRISVLCLRIARANHDCDPNACHYYDHKYQVKILFAERDIAPGEEICISYTWNKNIGTNPNGNSQLTPEASRAALEKTWGIICPEHCFCRNPEMTKLLTEARAMYLKITKMAYTNPTRALRLVKQLQQKQGCLRSGLLCVRNIHLIGFQLANKLKRLQEQNDFIQNVYEIECVVTSPGSFDSNTFLSFCNSADHIDEDFLGQLISLMPS